MSLNEIVNCPSQFASKSPYLVVQHIDWIQCRYLLVQASGSISGPNTDPYGNYGNQYGQLNNVANPTVVYVPLSSW
jgi:ubiquitin-conjugating enzyme E2 Q